MIDAILRAVRESRYDFRATASPDDPLSGLFDEWVDNYRVKWGIAAGLQPRSILEVGVRYGYSAAAFLDACPSARYVGIDIDNDAYGGVAGALDFATKLLQPYDAEIVIADTQEMTRFPGGRYDLIHVDGQQDGDGSFHDLELAVAQANYVLVDGYHWNRLNCMAVTEFMHRNLEAFEWYVVIPGYAGDLLAKCAETRRPARPAPAPVPLADDPRAQAGAGIAGMFPGLRVGEVSTGDLRSRPSDASADVVIASGANRWYYDREYPRRRAQAAALDAYLPPEPRTAAELANPTEHDPHSLAVELGNDFNHVVVWTGTAIDPYGTLDPAADPKRLETDPDLFAVASNEPIDRGRLADGIRMLPLETAVVQKLRLSVVSWFDEVEAGAQFAIRVRIDNESSVVVNSNFPYPVQLGHRWLRDSVPLEEYPVARTRIFPWSMPGTSVAMAMTIAAPSEPGEYELSVVAVQELRQWFDSPDAMFADRISVRVLPSTKHAS